MEVRRPERARRACFCSTMVVYQRMVRRHSFNGVWGRPPWAPSFVVPFTSKQRSASFVMFPPKVSASFDFGTRLSGSGYTGSRVASNSESRSRVWPLEPASTLRA